MVLDPDEDKGLKKRARQLFFGKGSKEAIRCSAPAVGEFVLTLARDSSADNNRDRFDRAMRDFWNYVREERLHIYMYGRPESEALALAEEVRRGDRLITQTDAAIVGCFLSDPDSKVLYSTDATLLSSVELGELIRAHKKRIRDLS